MKKLNSLNGLGGLVYSTDPDAMKPKEETPVVSLLPEKQVLRVLLDRKQRKGKTVTVVTGFEGNEKDLQDLGKKLKTRCGTGGSVKDGEILIQGDYKLKITEWLKEWGYRHTKAV